MKEMYESMDSVNQWIESTHGLMMEYNEDMTPEEQENLKKRAEVLFRNNSIHFTLLSLWIFSVVLIH